MKLVNGTTEIQLIAETAEELELVGRIHFRPAAFRVAGFSSEPYGKARIVNGLRISIDPLDPELLSNNSGRQALSALRKLLSLSGGEHAKDLVVIANDATNP